MPCAERPASSSFRKAQRFRAYADAEVPLPRGQHMLRPSVAGRLLQALLPQASEQVLEIGTGTGFISACLRVAVGPGAYDRDLSRSWPRAPARTLPPWACAT